MRCQTKSTAFSREKSQISTMMTFRRSCKIMRLSKTNYKQRSVSQQLSKSSSKKLINRILMMQLKRINQLEGHDRESLLLQELSREQMFDNQSLKLILLSQLSICLECLSTAHGASNRTIQDLLPAKILVTPTALSPTSLCANVPTASSPNTVVKTASEPTGANISPNARAPSLK